MIKLWESKNGGPAIVVTAAIHKGEAYQPYFANHAEQYTTIEHLDLYQVMRAAGHVESLLGLTAHTKYEKSRGEETLQPEF
jgi:hypothetical protein